MKIGAMPPRDGADVGGWLARLTAAEKLGYSFLATPDNFAAMLLAGQATQQALVGPTVTVPQTRHPIVMAAEASMVNRAIGGRLAIWIGRGFSSVQSIGEPMATTDGMADYLNAVQTLLRGEVATWRGQEVTIGSPRRLEPEPVRFVVSAYGPRTMRMAGGLTQGVGIASAASPAQMKKAIEVVRNAAADAGRDPASVEIWAMVRASVRDTYEEALADLKANLASGVQHIAKTDPDTPPDVRARIEELRAGYRTMEHVVGGGHNERLFDELGLADFAADRLAICGTPQQCRERILGLSDAGVDYLYFAGATRDHELMIRRMATEVVPELFARR